MQTCDQIHSYKTSLLLLIKLALADRGGRVKGQGQFGSPPNSPNTTTVQTHFKHPATPSKHPPNTLKIPINTLQPTFKIISFFP